MEQHERLAYIDCASGASAQMFLGALISAGFLEADLRDLIAPLEAAGARPELTVRQVAKGPVAAVHVRVGGAFPAPRPRLADMAGLVRSAQLPPAVVTAATAVMGRMVNAAARHAAVRPQDLVLDEAGALGAVVGSVGVVGALVQLGVRRVYASPVNAGKADPMVTALLAGVPTYSDSPGVPLVTPLGAALLAELVAERPASPPFAGGDIGHGAGERDLPRPNVMRCFLGYGTIPAPVNVPKPE
ncbi:MAG TPA: nickel insertion protein [candidate division Zixibacteria bacterium]|nr:nickel insertion protein [candidate division Zixibacteria bacterium]